MRARIGAGFSFEQRKVVRRFGKALQRETGLVGWRAITPEADVRSQRRQFGPQRQVSAVTGRKDQVVDGEAALGGRDDNRTLGVDRQRLERAVEMHGDV